MIQAQALSFQEGGLAREAVCSGALEGVRFVIMDCMNYDESRIGGPHALRELSGERETVWLLPGYAGVMARRKAWAREHAPGILGVKVTTLDAYVSDLWDLYGDGRRIVSNIEREILLTGLLAGEYVHGADGGMLNTPGTVRLIAKTIARGSGLTEFENIKRRVDGDFAANLAEAEHALLRIVSRYDACLAQDRAIEQGSVLALLPDRLPENYSVHLICEGHDPLDVPQQRFLDALKAKTAADVAVLDDAPARSGKDSPHYARELRELHKSIFCRPTQARVEPSGAVRFLLPTGRYAKPSLLAETIDGLLGELSDSSEASVDSAETPPIVVVCKDPHATYELLVRRLASKGIACAVQGRKAFSATAFGRAFLALAHVRHDEEVSPAYVTDFLESPFSGLSIGAARRIDARMRKNRSIALDRNAIWAILQDAGEQCMLMAELAESGDALQIKGTFEAFVAQRRGWSDAFRAEQVKAFSVLCEIGNEAERLGIPFAALIGLLESAAFPLSVGTDEDVQVLFCDERTAAQNPPGSAEALIHCDMNASDYPVRESADAETTFFAKIGIDAPFDALRDARTRFARVLAVPRSVLLCERILNDVNADESYPSVMFQEVIDCYREDITADDLDGVFGLPPSLRGFIYTKGEDGLQDCVSLDGASVRVAAQVPLGRTGALAGGDAKRHILPLRHASGVSDGSPAPLLSPTALELYLECPYRWFMKRRLRVEALDAGFGPLEKGQLVHEVMRTFYQEWQTGDAARRVVPENVEEAVAHAAEVFDRCYAGQLHTAEDPYLVVNGPLEEQQICALRNAVLEFVQGEATFLKGFVPRYLEYPFGFDAEAADAFPYARCLLRGCIDRIDVDEQGRAVVIDYKYSARETHRLLSKDTAVEEGFCLPQKVQTLMYAQFVRKVLGLQVVGAVYVGYGKGNAAGAFDDAIFDPQDLRMDAKLGASCGIRTTWGMADFSQLLDTVEERIAHAVDALMRGDIMPDPLGKEICTWCEAVMCDARRV